MNLDSQKKVTEKKSQLPAHILTVGMVIMPPAGELRWMRRAISEKGLSESALHLTIVSVEEGRPDKGGRWLRVKAQHSEEWAGGRYCHPWTIKIRPETLWPVIGCNLQEVA